MIHLKAIRFQQPADMEVAQFPFTVPVVAGLAGTELPFPTPVTFLIGENGSGKSTVLEALACAIGSIAVGSDPVEHDATLKYTQRLATSVKIIWQQRTRRGFFMRSEDFFGYAKRMAQLRAELESERQKIADDSTLSATARGLGMMPYNREISDMQQRYGASLDAYSHGESFFTLFQSRFVPNGLYLLDEPEAPLSPMRQLAFIAMVKEMVAERAAQFIIATHSPILMAFPNATIYSFDAGVVRSVKYGDTEHVTLTRDFLNNPERYLKHL